MEHLWWDCPAWNHIRTKHANGYMHFREMWPACFRDCGLMPLADPRFDHLGMASLDWRPDTEFDDNSGHESGLGTAWSAE
eukprot:9847852-Karenia_brevis.AAC.1